MATISGEKICRTALQLCRSVDKKPHDNTLVKFGYAVETTAGDKPSSFTWLERCNNINGLNLSTEIIDREI